MAGWVTNGLPLVSPVVENTVTETAPNGLYTNLGAAALLAVDTELASGQTPQSVAATPFQIAAFAAELIANTASSSAAAATLNTTGGMVTTEALTTAAGGTYTFTLTDSLLTTLVAAPQVQVHNGSNTVGPLEVLSVVNGSGSAVIKIVNQGTAALNGTLVIAFHV